MSLYNIFGLEIVTSELLVKDGDPYERKRSWKERLFTRPWRPFKKTETVVPKVPMEGAMKIQGRLMMHPSEFEKLKAESDLRDWGKFVAKRG